jgi:hypothetical protein
MSDFVSIWRNNLMPLREQAALRNAWLRERLDTLLPELMAREGFDAWIVAAREYNEDPVMMTLLPEPAMSARRRTVLLFLRNENGSVDRLTIDRYGFGEFYRKSWDADSGEDQLECLARILTERQPPRIGLNVSALSAFGDGLTHSEYQQIAAALGPTLMERTSSAERLCSGWLERRIAVELEYYPAMVALGHAIIAEAFSSRTISPGGTTTEDVVWWMRQTMHDLGLRAWFQPTVDIQARDQPLARFYAEREKRTLIQRGDLLHCDIGFYYLGLATDQQQQAYVLAEGETAAPAGLQQALANANRLQDIHMAAMRVGRTGNEVLAAALAQAAEEDINASIYSHPLGYHGHAAGPTIGLWDQQGGVPGKGDYELFDETVYSIELNAITPVPEWDGQEVRMALEEDAVLWGGEMRWLNDRQTALHLI